METLALSARGLEGIIETLAVFSCKSGERGIYIRDDVMNALHAMSLDIAEAAEGVYNSVWNANRSANDSANRSANE
jgi:hypothetical protein